MGTEFLAVQTTLSETATTRQDVYDLINQAKPTAAMADSADSATDKTLEVLASGQMAATLVVPRWRVFQIDYQEQELAVAGLSASVNLFELGAGGGRGIVHAVFIKHAEQWGGPDISALGLEIGTSGATDEFYGASTPYNLVAAVSESRYGRRDVVAADAAAPSVGDYVQALFTATGANLDQLTSGSVKVCILYSEVAALAARWN